MIRRALRGLRGRLLLALVATSAVTLVVAAAITLSPLQERLRNESASNLRIAAEDMRTEFTDALQKSSKPIEAHGRKDYEDKVQQHRVERSSLLFGPAFELRERTGGARVMIADLSFTTRDGHAPGFIYDTDAGVPQARALEVAFRALRENAPQEQFEDDELQYALPLYAGSDQAGVLVVQRNLTEVSTAVKLVRNALFTAAAVGLAVAIGLGLALSSTLTRRLGRLQRSALRITAEGPEAPAPTDRGRDEVGDLARALGRMQEELRRQETARRSFVSTASHELRTPLTMLQGTMELLDEDLRDGGDLTDAQEQVESARRELRRLSVLASELLDLSRLDAAVQLRSEPVELSELTRAVAAEFGLRAAERDVDLDIIPSEQPCWAKADPAACARVVRILIDNALRYAPPGRPIEVMASHDRGRVVVRVADHGPGVPTEEREHIFERFHRGKAASAESGFGLGLAIGRELAERMGGTLGLVDSAHGACFALTLPGTSGSSPSRSPAPGSAAAA
ncbi:MAG TPA: HAMP domain-containing sensor histidine kinase [Solirubrobacter sp.]|nr:HAMP domain-containing sensor histidine kinase [Solirubrobacter sp.]